MPASAMSKGLIAPLKLLARCSAAVFGPTKVGLKVTVKVAVPPPGGISVLLSALMLKAFAFVPSVVIARSVRGAVPGLVMVKVLMALLPPVSTVPKSTVLVPSVRALICLTMISGTKYSSAPIIGATECRVSPSKSSVTPAMGVPLLFTSTLPPRTRCRSPVAGATNMALE